MTLHRFTFRAMAAQNEVQLHADDIAFAESAAARAIEEVARIEAKFSRYRDDSVLSRINAQAGAAPVAIDEETQALLAFADACFRQSDGLFDATAGVLRRAWDFKSEHVPGDAELAPLLALVGWRHVELAPGTVRLARDGMQLDFGGFGKEYAVDRAARVLKDAGVASGLVNLAGDVAIIGPQPDAVPWRVGIRHPRRDDALLATLPVSSGALATSGDYERFIEVDGVRHCHILDPRTGRSTRGFRSVTVHGPSCLVAGSATTIAMLKGTSEGLAWLDHLGLTYLAVTEQGRVVDRFATPSEG
jgi:thiamine biosynthesis lipoprotein